MATLLRVHIRGTMLLNLYVAHHYALGDVFFSEWPVRT